MSNLEEPAASEVHAVPRTSLAIVSDFNLRTFGHVLERAGAEIGVRCYMAPMGEPMGVLRDPPWTDPDTGCLVWTRPEAVLPAFRSLLDGHAKDSASPQADVDAFAQAIGRVAERSRFVLLPTWVLPPGHRGLGMLDLRAEYGPGRALLEANARLVEQVSAFTGVYPLDASRWMGAGLQEDRARMWYLGRAPLAPDDLERAATDVLAALRGLRGGSRKLVVLDLDDTLWGGILGDVGWEGVRLGGHDPIGEAFVDFQASLLSLSRRGIALGVISKNDEARALEAMERHPEMLIRPRELAGWRINWEDKARNLAELVAEINVGMDSVVFIDDNPSERGRVREALPEVLVPDWPDDPLRFAVCLRGMTCFDTPTFTEEDRRRTEMYVAERMRRESLHEVGSEEAWLESLGVEVDLEALARVDLPRATQLLNKTNQMNLTTRRLTEEEYWRWSEEAGNEVFVVRVRDRFGDYGLTGLLGLTVDGAPAEVRVVDFVLSCRVFGRKVEETMLHFAGERASAQGALRIVATLIPTSRNGPCLEFWRDRSGFLDSGDGEFTAMRPFPTLLPPVVALGVPSR